ncbi:hypothetical protein O9H85_29990 [Paenibacillus filicis]|uniref:Uncharacterized protein n=1 Tax=Paenibacillus gyeongsangnamensis TaxID=3388067 RepID=A0ABT4QID9_9BACL|nr:hypothetical protein [Paenibacillus filicis]MCZ8516547.1 hypothetical protein [Paenibacillus filicis]
MNEQLADISLTGSRQGDRTLDGTKKTGCRSERAGNRAGQPFIF